METLKRHFASREIFESRNNTVDNKHENLFLSWRVLMFLERGKVGSFSDIIYKLKHFASNQSSIICETAQICKLLYINRATPATCEGSIIIVRSININCTENPACEQR